MTETWAQLLDTDTLRFVTVVLIVFIGAASVVTLVWILQWRKLRQTQIEMETKTEMIRQGLKVDEIERLLRVGHRR